MTRMRPTLRARLRWMRPQLITPCSWCGEPSGFWVCAPGFPRRPWCLSCIDGHRIRGEPGVHVVRFDP